MDSHPATPESDEVTRILTAVAEGEPHADERLLRVVYAELKRLAAARMSDQRAEHTLQPTALVHEAYLRLMGGEHPGSFHSGKHFFTTAATAMRSILVDHARRKRSLKRGGSARRVTLHPDLVGAGDPFDRVLQVHDALDALGRDHPRTARIVELLFFAGLTSHEAAGVLDVSYRTVEREWRFARAWLLEAMEEG